MPKTECMRGDSPELDDRAIKTHVRKHYAQLYEGRQVCRVPVRTGMNLAASLGYPLDLIDFIPESYWQGFVPCGNPLRLLHPASGERILNLGCGAAIDSFALWASHGASVQVVSMDVVPGVLQKAAELARSFSLPRPESPSPSAPKKEPLCWVCADGDHLPFRPECFDRIMMNGVFNLFPDKASLLKEVSRVLSPAGQLVGTDLCTDDPLPDYFHQERDAWAWCMSGACTEDQLTGLLKEARFEGIELHLEEDWDMFHRVAFCCRKSRDSEINGNTASDIQPALPQEG